MGDKRLPFIWRVPEVETVDDIAVIAAAPQIATSTTGI
jgi:hypothetical protein